MFNKNNFLVLTAAAAVFASACGGNSPAGNSTQTASNANSSAAVNAHSTTVNTSGSKAASIDSNNVSVGEVERIKFAKGAAAGTASVSLAPDAAKQFAVEATYGQHIKVSTDSKSAVVKMISGTDRQVESAGGGLNLQVQTTGDVLFEVRNNTTEPIKTGVRVEIKNAY